MGGGGADAAAHERAGQRDTAAWARPTAGEALPTFLIIGAAKSGTTSLAAYLAQHPEVFIPPRKEPNYFALGDVAAPPRGPAPPEVLERVLYNLSTTDRAGYVRLFAQGASRPARGEASVRYLYFPQAAARIRTEIPHVRLVAILRDPVERVYSHYNMNRQYQLEPLDLPEALEAEGDRIRAGWGWDWHYAAVSRYAEQIARYRAIFGRDALAVFLTDDLRADPDGTMRAICRHIGVDDGFRPDTSARAKVSYRPRNLRLDRAIHWPHPLKDTLSQAGLGRPMLAVMSRLARRNRMPVPPLDPALRRSLAARFHGDLADLADVLGRRLPWGDL